MTTTDEILNETFKKVGNDFGCDTPAEFAAYRDFKIRWQRSYKWAEFQVSDYPFNSTYDKKSHKKY